MAITGTNGKTTTTALCGEIMANYYRDVKVVGNIGIPYTSVAADTTEDTVTVAEISSFQLETIHIISPGSFRYFKYHAGSSEPSSHDGVLY